MFLCQECRKKYRIRPDYCDCGNDTFEKINRIPDKSVFIFIACLILSFVILWIPINIDSSKKIEQNKPAPPLLKNEIPNIDTFWNDKPAFPKTPIPITIPKQKKENIVHKAVEQPMSNTNEFISKTTKKIYKQPQIPTQTKVSPLLTKKQQIQPKPRPKVNAAPQPKSTKKVLSSAKNASPSPIKSNTSAKDSEELYRYKLGLRQALFNNLSVVTIQGSGKCGIEFSIDKNGKLTNRAFTFKSDNISVNDEVYKMLMKMPKYYAPPKAYNGAKIKLIFEFNNGSYIINYVN